MRKVVEFFVKFPIWANAILVTLVLFGVISYAFRMKKAFFPERDPGRLYVAVAQPGASPEEMEEGVTLKVEEALQGIEGIDEITSISTENASSINIQLLKEYDTDEILAEVKNAVDGINSFPLDAEPPVVAKLRQRSRGVNLALYGDVSRKNLKRFAEQIEDEFLASGLISKVNLSGYPALEISIEVPEVTLSRYGLTFTQVANAVRGNNRDISAGSIKAKDEEILIRSRAKEKLAQKIGDIVLRANPDGSKLFLRDIAVIQEQFADTPNDVYINGKSGVQLEVTKLPEEDLEEISDYVKEYVLAFNERNEAIQLDIAYNSMTYLDQRLATLIDNGKVGLFLVVLCLGFFLNLRLAFWVALGIPISFMGMLLIASLMDVTINVVSLFGMILVVGILVDDGIVIAENIYAHLEKGKSPVKAAIDGTMEVMGAVFTSVLTTVVAFIPLLMLDGFEFFYEMAVVVMVCLLISLVEAFLVLPAHLVIREKSKPNLMRRKITELVDYARFQLYGKALEHILSYRYIYAVLPVVFVMLVSSLFSGGFIGRTLFPSIPPDTFEVNIAFTPGTPEEKVLVYLKRFDSLTWVMNDGLKEEYGEEKDFVKMTQITLGKSGGGVGETGSHTGQVTIFPLDIEERTYTSTIALSNRLRGIIGKIPEAEKFQVGGANRFGKPISISLLGSNPVELEKAKEELKAELATFPGLKNIGDNNKVGRRELQLELQPQAYFLGLDHNSITRQIRQGFFGEEVQRLQKGSDEVKVWVRYPESDRKSLGQLEDMKIKTETGSQYPLDELIDYTTERGIVDIAHYNGKREIVVDAEFKDPNDNPGAIISALKADFLPNLLAKYPSLSTREGGQAQRSAKVAKSLQEILPVIIFIIILLLTLAFRSFSQTFLVLSMIPIGYYCAVLGHGIETLIHVERPVSLFSNLGVLALAGVIINDAVVFLEKYNINLREGKTAREAVLEAGISRYRPILLTSITTVAGLYPLILETSAQAQFLIPMAISVAYGVFLGTIFILTTFPAIILVANDLRRMVTYLIRLASYKAHQISDSFGHFFDELINEYKLFLPVTFVPLLLVWVVLFFLAMFTSKAFEEIPTPDSREVEPAIREQKRLRELAG
ncbi:MAG: efflux RND transporter permease subunit [Bacteroidota bacterium]